MRRLQPGWLVAFCALVVGVSCWLPWVTTSGEHASAIAGSVAGVAMPRLGPGQFMVLLAALAIVAGAMTARGLSGRLTAVTALVLSIAVLALGIWYYRMHMHPPLAVGYGFYIAAVAAVGAVACAVWATALALFTDRPGSRS